MTEIIHSVLNWLSELGYLGIALGLMLEVIPSEVVLSYGGYMISQGTITFVGAVIAGTIGGVIAQLFLYLAGYYGGRPLLERYGKYVFITNKHIDIAERWFVHYGGGVIFGARFIPVVRHAISIPAGVAKMSFAKFTVLTTLAVIPWSIFFLYLGFQLGDNWASIKGFAQNYLLESAILAIILLLLYFLWKGRKRTNI